MNNYTVYEVTIKNTNQDLLELKTVINNVMDLNKLLLALSDAPNYQLIRIEKVEGNFTPFEEIIETLVEDSRPKDLENNKARKQKKIISQCPKCNGNNTIYEYVINKAEPIIISCVCGIIYEVNYKDCQIAEENNDKV